MRAVCLSFFLVAVSYVGFTLSPSIWLVMLCVCVRSAGAAIVW